MKKIISAIFALCVVPAIAATAPQSRVSIFSTSTDWQAVTGLTLNEYNGKFIADKKLVGRGLVLYYLDGFPCYGLGFGVRVWVGPDGKTDNDLAIACVAAPSEIKFAYRNATRDADQATTTGILTCPVSDHGRDLTIDLSDCIVGPDWDDYK
ncbi:MAG: hypothetical protein J6Q44_01490 [Alphaproteobacteria bacterium]|nr:hypothetical protein [Alphaproteobacteria bacterium]